jgi:hypothetical protein
MRKTPYRAFTQAVCIIIPYVFSTSRSGGNRHDLLVSPRSSSRRTFEVTVAGPASDTHIIRYGARYGASRTVCSCMFEQASKRENRPGGVRFSGF